MIVLQIMEFIFQCLIVIPMFIFIVVTTLGIWSAGIDAFFDLADSE